MTVQNFVKIVWTVFEKFEIFMKRSGEKKTKKKQHDCISSRKFFPTPKNFSLTSTEVHRCLKTSHDIQISLEMENDHMVNTY